jgi:hypothetical protein
VQSAAASKGAVENLVGFVKRAFFRARRFVNLDTDLPQQLADWLLEVNTVRPCRATKEIPVTRLPAEQARMKPLVVAPSEYGLRFAVTVGPTAMVTHLGSGTRCRRRRVEFRRRSGSIRRA